jgi:hypothetical protein
MSRSGRDFPAAELADRAVGSSTPTPILCELLADHPHEVVATFVRLAGGNHPATPELRVTSWRRSPGCAVHRFPDLVDELL